MVIIVDQAQYGSGSDAILASRLPKGWIAECLAAGYFVSEGPDDILGTEEDVQIELQCHGHIHFYTHGGDTYDFLHRLMEGLE